MNSLPPELVSSIIESAAECSSLYESYKARLQTLSAIALVNRTFHEIAQPLFSLAIFVKAKDLDGLEEMEVSDKLMKKGISHKTISLTFESLHGFILHRAPKLDGFSNLKALRLADCYGVSLRMFHFQQHLTTLAIVSSDVGFDSSSDPALSSLIELTIEQTKIRVPHSYKSGTIPFFLTETHFPSLRALGLYKSSAFAATSVSGFKPPLHPSFLARLDCLTVDDLQFQRLPFHLSVPFLYDVDPNSFLSNQANRLMLYAPIRLAANLESAWTKHRVRIRFPCEPIAGDHQVEAALSFVETLLVKSKVLEELYLDLYPRDGRREYVLVQSLKEKIEKLEDLAKEKKVEIVWENHEDDWCRSRVSKEFWRRCKEKKEM